MSDERHDAAAKRRALSSTLGRDGFRSPAAVVKVQFGARSHTGRVRTINTDHYLVADGLGDSGAGAVASRVAISTFAHLAIH